MAEWFTVKITSQQRTSFGTGGERAYLTHTHPFLPGSVLRGALAAAWLRNGEPIDEGFSAIFERGRFSPAFPSWAQVQSQSVSRCKYHKKDSGHAEYIDHAFKTDCSIADSKLRCEASREYLKGACTHSGIFSRITTALAPRTNTAAESQLFAREMIEKGTVFTGHIVLPDGTDTEKLEQLRLAYFGGRGTVMGRCTVDIRHDPDGPPGLTGDEQGRVVVRTISPTILVDDAGFPSTDLASALECVAGVRPDEGRLWASRAESGLASGWHAASGLPKPAEIALVSGAVAVLTGFDPGKLRELLDKGLGLRRNEGYGWVEVMAQPWRPVTETPRTASSLLNTPQQARDDGAKKWLAAIKELQLEPAQKKWFADQLRRFRAGQNKDIHLVVNKHTGEPIARQLTDAQRDGISKQSSAVGEHQQPAGGRELVGVEELLRTIPNGIRNAVATAITKEAGR
ncbi:hypothetical protein [Propionibacterium australiense]|uniref:Uncharacterized protein n=1 Tax=Propionibacterium australiense TaxID=119981 RepID=A0A383S4N4_9ACTN|nr:hypothetical protein [Propionibacterium australiense]RLP10057.1 hypothetical protein D9T14_05855 [Propionibacterium australiense]RLP11342.1 hypothetical protein D7U36_04295 [Propionibacterium australiense]SYZ32978.1 Hypothetical protein PROPAUS_0889 [Propionibacterium australiense]VEH92313.1 CRISPR-associated RAMP protein, Csx10 family [Propionibacterium australiense]